MQLRHVTQYHADMRDKGANMTIMTFTKLDTFERYQTGWVVSGYCGLDSHKYFKSKAHAYEFMHSKNIALNTTQLA